MKKIIIIAIMLVLFIYPNQVNATEEITLSNAFNSLFDIIKNNPSNFNTGIWYEIYILKNYPESLEAFYATALFDKLNDIDIVANKIKRIPDDYSLESNAVEIILNSMIILNSDFDANKEKFMEKLKDYLINLSHSDKNQKYSPLASLILMKNQELKKTEYIYFKEHFINSPGMPLVDLLIVNEYYLDRQYEKCIQEANKLIEKYKEIVSPFGWKLVMDYYGLLIHCYVEINDTENAEKYYEMIKKEAPDYYFLNSLKMLIRSKK